MRVLVGCQSCRRQYDAQGLHEGQVFHCACGSKVRVPKVAAQDAAVIRCSSCGAPRAGTELSCSHCGSDYTLHERDRQTICAACMTRVSNKARFCHHCATPIVPEGRAGTRTEHRCPVCGERHRLNHRSLGEPSMAILECPRCAGLWLGAETLKLMIERARSAGLPADLGERGGEARGDSTPAPRPGGSLYRKCPVCNKLMNRRNYGRKSGVIVDECREDGVWFDDAELESVLRWVGGGGESQTADLEREEARQAAIRECLRHELDRGSGARRREPANAGSGNDLFGSLIGGLFGS